MARGATPSRPAKQGGMVKAHQAPPRTSKAPKKVEAPQTPQTKRHGVTPKFGGTGKGAK